jgi:type IV pilus assembly protein PilV
MNPMRRRHACFRSSSGFTMIEVMVALLILAVGLFGMLGITANSLKFTTSANYRTIAAQQAYAMAEALRANPSTLGVAVAGDTAFVSTTPASTPDCVKAAGCGRSAFINNAVYMWQQAVRSNLPSGAGTVCRDSAAASNPPNTAGAAINWNCSGDGQYVVKVCWNESRVAISGATAAAAGYSGGGANLLCTWTAI